MNVVRRKRGWLRYDAIQFVIAVLAVVSVAMLLPSEMFRPTLRVDAVSPDAAAPCGFVRLTPDAEMKAMAAVRMARSAGVGAGRDRIALLARDLPTWTAQPILAMSSRPRQSVGIRTQYRADLTPPTLAAGPLAARVESELPAASPVFSKEELLRID